MYKKTKFLKSHLPSHLVLFQCYSAALDQLWETCLFKTVTSVQLLSHVQLFAILWTVAPQASLSIANSLSLLKLTSTESEMTRCHLSLVKPHKYQHFYRLMIYSTSLFFPAFFLFFFLPSGFFSSFFLLCKAVWKTKYRQTNKYFVISLSLFWSHEKINIIINHYT